MARHALAGLIAALLAAPATAQVYRCGSTYSQTPCAVDAKQTAIAKGAAPTQAAAAGLVGRDLCAQGIAQHLGFQDPKSAGIAAVSKAPAESIQYAGAPLLAHKFVVNARARLYACYLSEDERRLLVIGPPPESEAEARIAAARSRPLTKTDDDAQAMERARILSETTQKMVDSNNALIQQLIGPPRSVRRYIDPAPAK